MFVQLTQIGIEMGSSLNPYIAFNGNAREAVEFYKEIFGGELHTNTAADFGAPADAPGADKLVHAVLETKAGYTLMAWDTPPEVPFEPGNNVAVYLGGDDDELRVYFEKLAQGGTITMPLEKQPWGDEAGSLIDKFGIPWMFNVTQAN